VSVRRGLARPRAGGNRSSSSRGGLDSPAGCELYQILLLSRASEQGSDQGMGLSDTVAATPNGLIPSGSASSQASEQRLSFVKGHRGRFVPKVRSSG
jgi:hypothetical protein